jgi:hypothetical protein
MDTNKEAKKYLNKYFKAQYLKETDEEYKALVKLLNKALRIHDVVGRSEQLVCNRCKEQDKEEPTDPYCMECKIEIEQQAN